MAARVGTVPSPGPAAVPTRREPVITDPGSGAPGRTRKDLSIESLRGLAIILMVAGHVIGDTGDRGLEVADDSGWRLAYLALDDVRLPLFTFLSGFVYAYRPVRSPSQAPGLVRGKARRLLVPMVSVGLLLLLVQAVTPGTNADPGPGAVLRILFFGYEHLWFVQAIFLVFLVVGLLDAVGALRRPVGLLTAVVVASAAAVLVQVPAEVNLFSANGALDLLPFFLLGYAFHRWVDVVRGPRVLLPVLAGLVVLGAVRVAGLLDGAGPLDATGLPVVADRLLGLGVGVLGVTTLFLLRDRLRVRALAWLGGFAYTIYLLHVFGSAGARLVLERLGLGHDGWLFVLALVAGLALPVVFELVAGRYRVVSVLLLGTRRRRPAGPRGEQQPLSGAAR